MDTTPNDEISFSEFPSSSQEQWRQVVEKDLKGKPFEQLIWTGFEGISMPPMAFFDEGVAERMKNLQNAGFNSDPAYGPRKWFYLEKIDAKNAKKANKAALAALENGADGVWFLNAKATDMQILMQGIMPQYCSLCFSPAGDYVDFWKKLDGYYSGEKLQIDALQGFLDIDPLREAALDKSDHQLSNINSLLTLAKNGGGVKVFTVDTALYANAGADAALQIALGLHHLVAYADILTDEGNSANQIFNAIQLKAAVGGEYFIEIAKLRAFSHMASLIAAKYGVQVKFPMHVEGSLWSKAFYDPYVNMLRNTTEAMSAILGGADSLSTPPHIFGLEEESSFGNRMSRNISLILREESYFDKVADPVAGSFYIEQLTDSLIQKSHQLFLELESKGSYLENLKSGYLVGLVEAKRREKQKAIAIGKSNYIGTNIFPNSSDTASQAIMPELAINSDGLAPRHGVAEIEQLRMELETSEKIPEAVLWPLSKGFMTSARINFCLSYLGVAGIEIREWVEGAPTSNADFVVFCGADEDYALLDSELIAKVKARFGAIMVLAGLPADHTERLSAAGIEAFIHAKSSVTDDLKALLSLRF